MKFDRLIQILKKYGLLDLSDDNRGDLQKILSSLNDREHSFPKHLRESEYDELLIMVLYLLSIRSKLQRQLNDCRNLNSKSTKCHIKADKQVHPPGVNKDQEDDTDIPIIHFNLIGGFHKPPKDSFFDLVRRTHSSKNKLLVSKIVITDPYLYADVSANGIEGGFSKLIEYIFCVVKDYNSSFELCIPQSGKLDQNHNKKNKLVEAVKSKFPNSKISNNPSKPVFHDRFYITKFSNGSVIGLFGPSLNGLDDTDVVIMGEIDDSSISINKLKTMLNV